MEKFIATESSIKAICACTSQAQIEETVRPSLWADCLRWFLNEPRSAPSGATYRGETRYSDGSVIDITENKTLVKECLLKGGEGYSTAIINSTNSCLHSFKEWGWSEEKWLFTLKLIWNGSGRQGSPRIQGYSIESEMLWTKQERACQKFAKLLRQIKSFKGEVIPPFEKLCYSQPQPTQPQPTQPQPTSQSTPVAQPQGEDWRVAAIKAAIKAGLSDDGLGKLVKTLFN